MSVVAFHRSWGKGPTIVCLHSSGASSRQWEALARRLGERYRIVAADLAGHGRSADWGEGETPSLAAEIGRLLPLLRSIDGPFHLVGHSYGGAVAVKIAERLTGRVRSLAVFEPVMFRLLLDHAPDDPATVECVTVAGAIRAALDRGDGDSAARTFVDYWSGGGAWERLEAGARRTIVERMAAVMGCFDALFRDDTGPETLARLDAPALLMSGGRSPLSGRSATAFLARHLPRARRRELASLGHMGPVARPEVVNEEIERFVLGADLAAASAFATERLGAPAWGARLAAT